MKTELSKIAKDLEKGTITENEAQTLLLVLLGSKYIQMMNYERQAETKVQ